MGRLIIITLLSIVEGSNTTMDGGMITRGNFEMVATETTMSIKILK